MIGLKRYNRGAEVANAQFSGSSAETAGWRKVKNYQ